MAKVRKKLKYQEGGKNTNPPAQSTYWHYGSELLNPYAQSGPVTNVLDEITLTDDAPRNNLQLGFFSRMYPEAQYGNIAKYAGFMDNLGTTARMSAEIAGGIAPGVGESIDAYYISDALARGDKEEAAMYTAMMGLPFVSAPLLKTVKPVIRVVPVKAKKLRKKLK